MEQIPFLDPDRPYIPLFGPDHLAFVAVLVTSVVLVVLLRRRIAANPEPLRWILLAAAVVQQVGLYSYQVFAGVWDWGDSLPLHISRITTLLLIAVLLTRSAAVAQVAFHFSLFAWLTFMVPSRIQPFDHIMGQSFLISHVVAIVIPLFTAVAWGFLPTRRGFALSCLWFWVYFAVAVVANALTDGNYFYLRERPVLADLPTPLYWLGCLLVGPLLFWLGARICRPLYARLGRFHRGPQMV